MFNFSISNAVSSTSVTASPAPTTFSGGVSSVQKSASLYPQSSSNGIAQATKNMFDTPGVTLQPIGADVMQQTGPKANPSQIPSKHSFADHFKYQIPDDCVDGVLANAGAAAGQYLGDKYGGGYGEWAGGLAGQTVGAAACDVADRAAGLFEMGPENLYDPANYGNGGVCTDPGPTGGQSAGKEGGYCLDTTKSNASSSTSSEGVRDFGDVDSPGFLNGQSSSAESSSTSTDNSSQSTQQSSGLRDGWEVQQSTQPDGPKPDGDLPADDSSGSPGPFGPRANNASEYMPSDDSAGEALRAATL